MRRHAKTSFTAALLASTAFFHGAGAAAAEAADAAASAAHTEVEAITVYASRGQNQAVIEAKRDTPGISDFMTQDEVGQMPDLNLAEALRRVPGVTAAFEEDRGFFVVVRGLDPNFNVVAIDGVTLATSDGGAGNGRRVYLSVIPTTAASSIEVRKTFTPDIDGGSIGGYINLSTRSAYDHNGPFLIAEGGVNYFTYQGVPNVASGFKTRPLNGQANATFARTFGAEDQFGVVLSGNWQKTQRDEKKIIQSDSLFFNSAGAIVPPILPDRTLNPAWNGFRAPSNMRRYTYHTSVETYGLSGKFEYRPNDAFHAELLGFLYTEKQRETRKAFELWAANSVANQTATSGVITYSRADIGWITNDPTTENSGLVLTADYSFSERSRLSFRSGLSKSTVEAREDSILYRNTRAANRRIAYSEYDLNGTSFFDIKVEDVPALLNTQNYVLNNYAYNVRDYEDRVFDTLVDYSFNQGEGATTGFGFKVGAGHRKQKRDKNIDFQQFVEDGSTLTAYGIQTDYAPGRLNYPELWIDGPGFLGALGTRLTPDAADSRSTSLASDFYFEEESYTGFGMASWRTDRLLAVGGLRYEKIDVMTRSPNTALTDFQTRNGGYDAWLPSATLSYDLTEDWRLKAGASRSLGRPAPSSVAQREVRNDTAFTISRGNPDLKPRRATNLDLAVEYYFPGRGGMFTAGVFYKDIKDEIFNMVEQVRLDFNGVSQEYTLTTPSNAKGAEIRGAEFGFIDNALDFLPGPFRHVGISANLTYVDGEIAYRDSAGDFRVSERLLEQPRWFGNATVFYNHNDRFEARLSYNYKGAYLDEINVQPHRNAGFREQHNVDLTLRYDVSDHLIVKFQARNLLGEDRLRVRGFKLDEGREDIQFGRSAFLNLVYTY